ncbi:MAG: tetratricopeptide repeat protein, partial [Myxococcales bacterium]
FFLGHNMWDSGKEKDAVTVYRKLIKDHKASRYLPDAWVAIGQYFFNNSQGKVNMLEEALAAFQTAATFTDSKVYGYALYMQAWCFFNLGDYRAALDLFKAVVLFGELQGKSDPRSTALSKEARKDYVVAYSRIGDVLGAKADFQKVGGDEHWWTMLKGLANIYYGDGKDKEATLIYNQMKNERPLSPEAPFFQGRIVDCVMRVGNKKITVNQVRELVRVIKEVEKAGVITKDEDRKAFAEAKDLAERTLSNLAVNWHNEAKKTRSETTFFLAAEVYQDYLEVFGESPKSYDLRFFYAELLNDHLNKFDRAAEEYTKVVLVDIERMDPPARPDGSKPPPEKPGRWLVNAAYNAILAFDEVAKRFEQQEQLPESDGKTKLPIPPAKQNLLAACERYIRYVPQGDKRVDVMYKAASIYYRYNYFDRAVEIFGTIALEHPESELAEYAANLVLDSFNLQGDWAKMNEWARRFYAQPKLAKGKFREELGKVLEQSSFKLINLLEEKGEFIAAATAYLSFVDEFPKSSLADRALFNASVDFFKGNQIDRSIEVRKLLVERYPNSSFMPRCIYANGETYEAIGDFELAAESYEAYARAFAEQRQQSKPVKRRKGAMKAASSSQGNSPFEESKAQVALFNAGVFREGLGQYREALRDRQLYLELWPSGKDSEAVDLSIAGLLEKSGQANKALAHLEAYEKQHVRDPDRVLAAELKIVRIFEKMNSTKNSQRVLGRILSYYEKLNKAQRARLGPEAIEAVARASYAAIEPEFAAYSRISFPKDEKKLKGVLEAKQKALVDVQKRYAGVVNLKVAEPAICSLYKIGLLYKDFADKLASAPIPEMPFPKALNPIKHLMDRPWKKWPKDYRAQIPEATFEDIKAQLAEAKIQFEQAYRDQLMQLAMPVEEKAADAFETTVLKARELALYNDCSRQAYDLLADKYKPSQFPRVVEQLVDLPAAVEVREGSGLLTKVQPIPEPPKADGSKVVDPDVSRIPPRSSGPAARPERSGRGPRETPVEPSEPSEPSEPDDPDLL